MTIYYIQNDNTIVLYNTDRQSLVDTIGFMPQYQGLEIKETEGYIVDGSILTEAEYQANLNQKEQERINNLTMTALDLVSAIKTLGVDSDTIVNFIESNSEIKLQLLCCQNVYCGVVKQFCPINIGDVTLSAEMVEQIFKTKYSYGVADE